MTSAGPTAHDTRRSPSALLIVGHGTREPAGIRQFREIVQRVSEQDPHGLVRAAFLEFERPTVDEALARLAGESADEIRVLPLLLFAAGHAKEDIPALVEQARPGLDGIPVRVTSHLGCHPKMLALSDLRFRETVGELSSEAKAETLLLMVGRGSRDESATAEMHRYSRLHWQTTGLASFRIGFLAMAEPRLEQVLHEVRETEYRRVVIQPHLLFEGRLMEEVRRQVEICRRECPQIEWELCPPLGPHPLLAEAILGISRERDAADSSSRENRNLHDHVTERDSEAAR